MASLYNWTGCNSQLDVVHNLRTNTPYLGTCTFTGHGLPTYTSALIARRGIPPDIYCSLTCRNKATYHATKLRSALVPVNQPFPNCNRGLLHGQDTIFKGTITTEHHDRLKAKLTISVTDNIPSLELTTPYDPSSLATIPAWDHHWPMTHRASWPTSNSPTYQTLHPT